MIIHGNKQISERWYARKASEGGGAVRLTNIIRGAQVVFGGLVPNVKWLKAATTQAILAAFGQDDGYAVLGATNAYLNGIAATDPTKASALAGFINEDPMLVCSLGLQPQGVEMPIRKLVSDGLSWIMTGVNASLTAGFELDFELLSLSNKNCAINNVDYASGNQSFGIGFWDSRWVYQYGAYTHQDTTKIGVIYHYLQKGGNFLLEDNEGFVRRLTRKASSVIDTEMVFPGGRRNNSAVNSSAILKSSMLKMYEGDTTLKHFIPFISQTRDGMIDLVNMEFHPNQGTGHFTESYTLQDGVTPWTPLNQTT